MKKQTERTRLSSAHKLSRLGLVFLLCLGLSFCSGENNGDPDALNLIPDKDGDGINNSEDNCPDVANADQANADGDSMGDACDTDKDNDGEPNATDVDDDNDGLIEIATAAELNNMRHDLAGHSYDDEADDGAGNEGSTAGAPTSTTTLCTIETSGGSGIYLCGYELTANINFNDGDGNDSLIDLSIGPGNFDPIGADAGGQFTAYFEGNDHAIHNLNIDIKTAAVGDNDANDAGLIASCANEIKNLTLVAPRISGRRHIGALCATTSGATLQNVHVAGGAVQGDPGNIIHETSAGGLVGEADDNSLIEECSSSAHISHGGGAESFLSDMGGLVGAALANSRIIRSSSSGNVFKGGNSRSRMGGLVGFLEGSRVVGSSSSGNVFDGGDDVSHMGGLVGVLDISSRIIASRSSGSVSNGRTYMGGLVGFNNDNSLIIASRSSGSVSDGGDEADRMGGLVGWLGRGSQVVGSRSSGNVSNGGDGDDHMGGLVGNSGFQGGIVRDSFSSGEVCDGKLGGENPSTSRCSRAGDGADRLGPLIGYLAGESTSNTDTTLRALLHNCLAVGAARENTGDFLGFIGWINEGNTSKLNRNITNNRFDTETTMTNNESGRSPTGDTNLAGVTGGNTAAIQALTATTAGWSDKRWLFADGAYPRLLYFDYDPDDPRNENPTAATTIDVCETVQGNNAMVDEGKPDRPDCGDVLEAWEPGLPQ